MSGANTLFRENDKIGHYTLKKKLGRGAFCVAARGTTTVTTCVRRIATGIRRATVGTTTDSVFARFLRRLFIVRIGVRDYIKRTKLSPTDAPAMRVIASENKTGADCLVDKHQRTVRAVLKMVR